MRAEATHRLLLNAPLFPKMAFGIVEGKYVRFSLVLEGTLKTYLLKVPSHSLLYCSATMTDGRLECPDSAAMLTRQRRCQRC